MGGAESSRACASVLSATLIFRGPRAEGVTFRVTPRYPSLSMRIVCSTAGRSRVLGVFPAGLPSTRMEAGGTDTISTVPSVSRRDISRVACSPGSSVKSVTRGAWPALR